MSNLNENIKKWRLKKGFTLAYMSENLGVAEATFQRYESGVIKNIKYEHIVKMAILFNITPQVLMGWKEENIKKDDLSQIKNILDLKEVNIPVIGQIPCTTPQEAVENAIEKTFQFPEDFKINFDYVLKCDGDSMINAGIYNNDFVFIKKQDIVNNGEIAVILIDGNATLKRFYYDLEENNITLLPENPQHPPKTYGGDKLNSIKIIGKAIAVLNWLNIKKL